MLRFVFASISRSVGICYHQIELISPRTMIVKLCWLSININSAANWVNSPAPFPLTHICTHTHRCTTINYETKRYCHLAASLFDRATFNVPYIYIWPAVAALGRSQMQPQSTLPSQSLLQLQRRTCCRLSCCLVTR